MSRVREQTDELGKFPIVLADKLFAQIEAHLVSLKDIIFKSNQLKTLH